VDSLYPYDKKEYKTNPHYTLHGKYVNKLLTEFRSYQKLGLPLKPLRNDGVIEEKVEKRIFVWEKIERGSFESGKDSDMMNPPVTKLWLGGWRHVKNRNNMWHFAKDDRGSVHWYPQGLVLLYLKGEFANEGALARVKELFCRAFFWMSDAERAKYLDVPLQECSKKWIFKIGKIMPRFKIRRFERSHGMVIFTDGSHPDSLHVLETVPFWIDEQRQATAELGGVVQKLSVEIQAHLNLIQTWEKGASRNSEVAEKTLEVLAKLKEQLPSIKEKSQYPISTVVNNSVSKFVPSHSSVDSDSRFADYGD
jgi:hypothetical protein